MDNLTKAEKELIDELVKPEAVALYEFVESEFRFQGKLEELDNKHRNATLEVILKLLKSGLTGKTIKGLIKDANSGEWDAMDYGGELENIDKDDTQIQCMRVFNIDHANFHWTAQLVDDAALHAAKKRLAFSKSSHGRLGVSAEGPDEIGLIPTILRASLRKSKRKRKSKKRKRKKKIKSKKRKKTRRR